MKNSYLISPAIDGNGVAGNNNVVFKTAVLLVCQLSYYWGLWNIK
jgi:hypothetical protein